MPFSVAIGSLDNSRSAGAQCAGRPPLPMRQALAYHDFEPSRSGDGVRRLDVPPVDTECPQWLRFGNPSALRDVACARRQLDAPSRPIAWLPWPDQSRCGRSPQVLGNITAAGYKQMPVAEFLEAWTQIQTDAAGDGHGDVRVAVRIDGQVRGLPPLIAHYPFDGGAGLSVVEHQGLRVGDAPSIARMRIEADGGCESTRFVAGRQIRAGLHAHHVGGRQIGSTPGRGYRMAMHKGEHGAAGLCEASLVARPLHGLRTEAGPRVADSCARSPRRRELCHVPNPGIHHQQLFARSRLSAQHGPAEANLGIDGQNEFRQLCFAHATIERCAQLCQLGVGASPFTIRD